MSGIRDVSRWSATQHLKERMEKRGIGWWEVTRAIEEGEVTKKGGGAVEFYHEGGVKEVTVVCKRGADVVMTAYRGDSE